MSAKFENFELNEFIVSDTATRKRIDNTPTFEVVDHLEELISKILQPMRYVYGLPIVVTSGYRSTRLNKVVGGVATSIHKIGYAVDIQPKDMRTFTTFAMFVKKFLIDNEIKFDQCIIERKGSTRWIHIGLYNNAGQQRMQMFDKVV